MARYGRVSQERLEHVHPLLFDLCFQVVSNHCDNSVVYGVRTEAAQRILVEKGFSKTMNSMHLPRHQDSPDRLSLEQGGMSWAVDLAPYPINWNDISRFIFLGGIMLAIAKQTFPDDWYLRWGYDWDGDTHFDDQTFMDGAHFELRRGSWPKI